MSVQYTRTRSEAQRARRNASTTCVTRARLLVIVAALAWLLGPNLSVAQPAPPPPPPAPTPPPAQPPFEPTESPLLQPTPIPAGPPAYDVVGGEVAPRSRRWQQAIQAGVYLAVPTFFTGINDVASTGFGLALHGGYDFGIFVPEFYFGWQNHDLEVNGRSDDLNRGYLALGLKLEADNESMVTPFLGASFDLNWWSKPFEQQTVCGYYYCWVDDVYSFSPGFTGRAGVSIRPKPTFSIDLGVELGMSFQGGTFFQDEAWVGPILGATGYFPR